MESFPALMRELALPAFWLLLGTWVVFLVPAWRGPRRAWPIAAVVLGALALARELWFTFVVGPAAVGPIRLDIPVLAFVLAGLYGMAAWRLRAEGFARSAAVAGLLATAGAGGMALSWTVGLLEAGRMMALLADGDRMLFEARFADEEAFVRAFDMRATPPGRPSPDLPVGHWEVEGSPVHTRLVVNPAGRAFLYYRCGSTECQYGPGARLLASGGEDEGFAHRWETTLRFRGVGERHLVVMRAGPDPDTPVLEAEVDGRAVRLRPGPPPLLGLHEPESLTYLGAFAAVAPTPGGGHARVSQVWLWRDGAELLGVGIFEHLLPGRRADFVTPVVLGRGAPESGAADARAWRFRFRHRERQRVLRVAVLGDDRLELAFEGETATWPVHPLTRDPVFHDDVIELAPRSDAADWLHWFDVQLRAHFASAEIPAIVSIRDSASRRP